MKFFGKKPKLEPKNKKALITGIAGQDGSYLAEHLLEEGYDVYGIVRRNSVPEHQDTRIKEIVERGFVDTLYGDLLDVSSLERAIKSIQPDEVYNLAAQSHVRISFDVPQFTLQTNTLGVLNLLETCRSFAPGARIYQASSSEMFGNSFFRDENDLPYQNEDTPMRPVSPYGCAKLAAYHLARTYRESYGMFVSNGILFNHESPRRGGNFVTTKIIRGAIDIKQGILGKLELGNLDSSRDWGHSWDYVRGMKKILAYHEPWDFVLCTGETHTVRELCELVFGRLDMDYRDYVIMNPKYLRPNELEYLRGDCTRAKQHLGWKPEYDFKALVDEMVDFWLKHTEEE